MQIDLVRRGRRDETHVPICVSVPTSLSVSLHLRLYICPAVVKHLPASSEEQEMQFQSLGRRDPLEEGMTTHSSILAWSIPWREEPGGLQSMGS